MPSVLSKCAAGLPNSCRWTINIDHALASIPPSKRTLRANISETGLVLLINEQKGEKEEIRDEREFSWCCSFPWGFGCRGTERRLASWRAAAECSSSQSGRRSGAGFAAGSRSSCQTEAADLHG